MYIYSERKEDIYMYMHICVYMYAHVTAKQVLPTKQFHPKSVLLIAKMMNSEMP